MTDELLEKVFRVCREENDVYNLLDFNKSLNYNIAIIIFYRSIVTSKITEMKKYYEKQNIVLNNQHRIAMLYKKLIKEVFDYRKYDAILSKSLRCEPIKAKLRLEDECLIVGIVTYKKLTVRINEITIDIDARNIYTIYGTI
jgi:hypothetical protein